MGVGNTEGTEGGKGRSESLGANGKGEGGRKWKDGDGREAGMHEKRGEKERVEEGNAGTCLITCR
jgi:hypothetical protein